MKTAASHTAFLLYDNRSGSTMLSAQLDRFEGVSVTPETDLVFQVLEYRPGREEVDPAALVAHLYAATRIDELGLARAAADAAVAPLGRRCGRPAVLAALVGAYFRDAAPGAAVRVVKGPGLHYHLHTLAAAFPGARFLHLVRDGRAVFNSKRQTPGALFVTGVREGTRMMDGNLIRAAANWTGKIAIVEHAADLALRTVRYEDVVADPEGALDGILDFLQVPASRRGVAAGAGAFKARRIGERYAAIHANVGGEIDPTLAESWRRELSRAQIALYERLAGDALVRLGYALVSPPPRIGDRLAVAALYVAQLADRQRQRADAAVLALRQGRLRASLGRLLRRNRGTG